MGSRIPRALAEALDRGATVVAPHERAARAVRAEWDREQQAAGRKTWATPTVLSWRSWTTELWRRLQVEGLAELTLLNGTQEQRLWAGVLEASEQRSAAAISRLVLRCIEAHRRLESYVGDARQRSVQNAAGRPLSDWLRQVGDRCRREHLLLAAELDRAVAARLDARLLATLPSRELNVFGFDELTPAQGALCAAWNRAGGAWSSVTLGTANAAGSSVAAATEEDELRRFAQWASARLRGAADTRIALVVSDLHEQRGEIEASLREAFAALDLPGTSHPLMLSERPLAEFSLGRPVAREPLVRAALDLLRWTQAPLPLLSITRLLLSPHLADPRGHRPALETRTELDRKLRRTTRLRPEASVAEVVRICNELGLSPATPIWQSLRALLDSPLAPSARETEHELRPASGWVADIRSTLANAMWNHGASSYTYQLRRRWEALLDEVATLDLLQPGVSLSGLLMALEERARETVFAPESHDAPVQVLGPLEAAGQVFDALWVMGCSHLQWPPVRGTSPLLPLALQRETGAPGADRQRERQWATLLTTRLASSAPEVVFSFARHSREGAEQHLFPLLEGLHLPALFLAPTSTNATPRVPVERFSDTAPLAALPSSAVEGGARLLQLQAACGFRAFAELRLRAQELEHRLLGLDARERGTAVHAALDALWSELQTQERLLSLAPDERSRVLDEAVEHGMRSAVAQAGENGWEAHFLDVQRVRLRRLLEAWLAREGERTPFSVLGREVVLERVPVGPLQLSVRIDRLDLVDGHHVLLDYKTSKNNAGSWHGERPEQPQMLLYATLAAAGHLAEFPEAALGALAFANVVSGSAMSMSGLQQEGSALLALGNRRNERDLAREVTRWTEVVNRLASEFAAGDARVDPLNYPSTCQHCAQRLLCRLAPELLLEAEAGASEHGSQDG